jgi:predicted NUDIX family NTP pyrophosphohydrolase
VKKNQSAGILLYRIHNGRLQVLLVHPGGPFWKNKDEGAWTIPKGEFTDETPLAAAKREFNEETGMRATGTFIELTPVKQKNGKWVYAWALEGELDPNTIQSNTFEIEWPPKSGRQQSFPEVDKAAWFGLAEAKQKINAAQVALLEELENVKRES